MSAILQILNYLSCGRTSLFKRPTELVPCSYMSCGLPKSHNNQVQKKPDWGIYSFLLLEKSHRLEKNKRKIMVFTAWRTYFLALQKATFVPKRRYRIAMPWSELLWINTTRERYMALSASSLAVQMQTQQVKIYSSVRRTTQTKSSPQVGLCVLPSIEELGMKRIWPTNTQDKIKWSWIDIMVHWLGSAHRVWRWSSAVKDPKTAYPRVAFLTHGTATCDIRWRRVASVPPFHNGPILSINVNSDS